MRGSCACGIITYGNLKTHKFIKNNIHLQSLQLPAKRTEIKERRNPYAEDKTKK